MAEMYYPSTSGNGSVGSYYRNGYGRLYVYESAINPEENTSTLTIEYQATLTVSSSDFTRGGSISVDGDTRTLSGKTSSSTSSSFKRIASWNWTIPHDADGSKTVTITTSGGYGGGPSLYVYATSSQRRYANCVGAGTFTFELTKFDKKTGVPVHIGGAEYYAYIGNGSEWEQYDPIIG